MALGGIRGWGAAAGITDLPSADKLAVPDFAGQVWDTSRSRNQRQNPLELGIFRAYAKLDKASFWGYHYLGLTF